MRRPGARRSRSALARVTSATSGIPQSIRTRTRGPSSRRAVIVPGSRFCAEEGAPGASSRTISSALMHAYASSARSPGSTPTSSTAAGAHAGEALDPPREADGEDVLGPDHLRDLHARRGAEDVVHGADLPDRPIDEHHHPVAERERLDAVVRYHDRGHAGRLERARGARPGAPPGPARRGRREARRGGAGAERARARARARRADAGRRRAPRGAGPGAPRFRSCAAIRRTRSRRSARATPCSPYATFAAAERCGNSA